MATKPKRNYYIQTDNPPIFSYPTSEHAIDATVSTPKCIVINAQPLIINYIKNNYHFYINSLSNQ